MKSGQDKQLLTVLDSMDYGVYVADMETFELLLLINIYKIWKGYWRTPGQIHYTLFAVATMVLRGFMKAIGRFGCLVLNINGSFSASGPGPGC